MTETKNFFIYTLQSSIYCLFLNFVYSSTKAFGLVGGGGWGGGGGGGWGGVGGDGTGCVYHMILDPPPPALLSRLIDQLQVYMMLCARDSSCLQCAVPFRCGFATICTSSNPTHNSC